MLIYIMSACHVFDLFESKIWKSYLYITVKCLLNRTWTLFAIARGEETTRNRDNAHKWGGSIYDFVTGGIIFVARYRRQNVRNSNLRSRFALAIIAWYDWNVMDFRTHSHPSSNITTLRTASRVRNV